ncbi:Neuropeptide Y receptor type 4 [Mizuhopecten yessoensis]|uniref:Neuropeptide Y receptor type 4 n=1 Tax=Mizuhopecten yessoensis TaxID=6573 RepID=A0A210PM14_MIZYE|nr:Neuropeptide Y receptor type 4 [Mizuhopecten yessoensis]
MVISVIGIPGTVVTICFYGKRIKKTTAATPLILTTLAGFDMLSLIFTIPMSAVSIHLFYIDGWKQDRLFAICNAVTRIPKNCSNLMLLLIGIERLVSVAWPHKLKKIFTKKVGIVCVIVVCTIITPMTVAPMAIEPELVAIQGPEGDYFVRRMPQRDVNPNLYNVFYQNTILLYFVLPLGGVFVCNAALVVLLLKRSRTNRLNRNLNMMTPAQTRELRTTKLVMSVTVIFIVCILPFVVIFPIQTSSGADIPIKGMLLIIPLSMLLECITYSMNAVVYYIGNATFREEIREMMSCACECKIVKTQQVRPINTVSTGIAIDSHL